MKLMNRLDNYLNDLEYKIIIKENYVNIINYDEIIDFTLNRIAVKYKNKIISIEGKDLTISKMVDNEVLILGKISVISIN